MLFKQPLLILLGICCLIIGLCESVPPLKFRHKKGPPKKGAHEADVGAFASRDLRDKVKGGTDDPAFDHEAILGSAEEAKEFEELPPQEAKRRLAILLKRMDLNRDEKIDTKELKQWILRSFKMLSLEESADRYNRTDLNEDGFVTWREYLTKEFDVGEGGDFDGELEELMSDPNLNSDINNLNEEHILFQAADINGDEKLDSAEFISFSHPEEMVETMRDPVIRLVFKDRDLNQDGKIQFQEFLGKHGKGWSEEWVEDEKQQFDGELDTNHDGTLNREEIIRWMIANNSEVADTEIKHLFEKADDNADQLLTFKEILEHHDVFVGSEATDYGEHLKNLHKFSDEL